MVILHAHYTAFGRFARALEKQDAQVISQCLEENKKFDIADRFGNTILHIAATFGTTQVIERILSEGGDLDARNKILETPLHCSSGAPESTPNDVMSLLVSKRADINARNANQETPLHYAVRAANPTRVKRLLKAGADRTLVDVRGLTPKETAVRRGITIVIDIFSRRLGIEMSRTRDPGT